MLAFPVDDVTDVAATLIRSGFLVCNRTLTLPLLFRRILPLQIELLRLFTAILQLWIERSPLISAILVRGSGSDRVDPLFILNLRLNKMQKQALALFFSSSKVPGKVESCLSLPELRDYVMF